jgi:hypothetical protein
MPYRFELNRAHRNLLVVFEGDVQNRDMETVNGKIRRRHASRPSPCSAVQNPGPNFEKLP